MSDELVSDARRRLVYRAARSTDTGGGMAVETGSGAGTTDSPLVIPAEPPAWPMIVHYKGRAYDNWMLRPDGHIYLPGPLGRPVRAESDLEAVILAQILRDL